MDEYRPDLAYLHMVSHPGVVDWISRRLPSVAYVHSPFGVCPGYAQYLRRSARVCPRKAGPLCLLYAQTEKCCFGRSPLTHASRLAHVMSSIKAYRDLPLLVGSEYMRQLMHRNDIPLERIRLLAPVLFQEGEPWAEAAPDSTEILFVGRLRSEKGLHHLLEAVTPLSGEWRVVVAGDGEERDACTNLAERLGIAGRVDFCGWLSGSEIKRLYKRCAVVVVPSLWPEPYGRVGPEAFLQGRPVVGFGVGGVVDWLEDGVTGYLVSPGDVQQLGRRIQTLLESPSLRAQMGRNARARALEMWRADRHVEYLVRIFGEVSGGTRVT
jgi:glycosyltransferase involved in cell wall biosynthesis